MDKVIEQLAEDILNSGTSQEEAVENVVTEPQVTPAQQSLEPSMAQPAPQDLAPLLNELNGNIKSLGGSLKPQPSQEELERAKVIEDAKRELGLNNLAQVSQIEELKAQLQEMQAREAFKEAWRDFSNEFQGITMQELGAYAKSKGLEAALNNLQSWKFIGQMMKQEAAPKPNNEQVIRTAEAAPSTDIEKKIKNREDVSDIELAEYLLNGG